MIAAHDPGRFDDLRRAVASIREQVEPPGSITVVIDNSPALLQRCQRELSGIHLVPNQRARGASGARNTGADLTSGDVIAFMDDDAIADVRWITEMVKSLNEDDVLGVVGWIQPLWRADRPAWFPDEFLWAVGASYEGRSTGPTRVRNGWSGNMAVRRSAFEAVQGFREGFGKLGASSAPEDTDFCIRVNEHAGELAWRSAPQAIVHHIVPANRVRAGFYLRRCVSEGLGKAALRSMGGATLDVEAHHAASTIPRAILQKLLEGVTGRPEAIATAGALMVGTAAVGAGYLIGSLPRPRR